MLLEVILPKLDHAWEIRKGFQKRAPVLQDMTKRARMHTHVQLTA